MEMIRPYADHENDSLVQLAFTLPIPKSDKSAFLAKKYVEEMGMMQIEVIHEERLNSTCTYFIIYAKSNVGIPFDSDVNIETSASYTKSEIENLIKSPIVIVGASTGSDTHTVGLDAILNSKGYHSHCGLEAYCGIEVHNMGGQVSNEELIRKAVKENASAILVSQTVTQQDLHVGNLTELVDMLEASGLRDRFLLLCGGPRINSEFAKELGFDAGFSKGTYANDVAIFLVTRLFNI